MTPLVVRSKRVSPRGGPDRDRAMNLGVCGALEGFTSPIPETMRTAPGIRASSRRGPSFPITIRPTRADVAVARAIARDTAPAPEEIARALTWGADEKVLLVLAAAGWLASRSGGEPLRRAGNHAVLVTVAASLLPHGLKLLFDQTRPDRRTVMGHVHGISFSGKREDAFPSGHALHMGALASAAGTLPAGPRRAIRALAVGLSLTRVVVLAHWASDVVAGFALGAILERLLRLWTGYPLESRREDDHANS
jgi:membrane-associated phospholipid phosphatase